MSSLNLAIKDLITYSQSDIKLLAEYLNIPFTKQTTKKKLARKIAYSLYVNYSSNMPPSETPFFETFEKLLEYGRKLVSGANVSNITGVEDVSIYGQYQADMIYINNYIFTVASTNEPDKEPYFQPFFLEGVCPLSLALELREKLLKKHYFVLVQDIITKQCYGGVETYGIAGMQRKNNPDWAKQQQWMSFEFYQNCGKSDTDAVGYEVLEYTPESMYKGGDKIVGIFIEDSCTCRKELYKDVVTALKEIFPLK